MKRIALLIISILVVFCIVGRVNADDNGGTPPTCDKPDTQEALTRTIARLQKDRANEHVVFIDCLTNQVIVEAANGGPYATSIRTTLWQTSNELMVVYHPIGGDTIRFEDMAMIRNMNPLVVYVVAFDQEKLIWAACKFEKAAWDGFWPAIDTNSAYKDYQAYYAAKQGSFYRRTVDAYKAFWHAWTSREGVGFSCTSDT